MKGIVKRRVAGGTQSSSSDSRPFAYSSSFQLFMFVNFVFKSKDPSDSSLCLWMVPPYSLGLWLGMWNEALALRSWILWCLTYPPGCHDSVTWRHSPHNSGGPERSCRLRISTRWLPACEGAFWAVQGNGQFLKVGTSLPAVRRVDSGEEDENVQF